MNISEKLINDTLTNNMPYKQPNKSIDPIDNSNIPHDEPYKTNMVGHIVNINKNIINYRYYNKKY